MAWDYDEHDIVSRQAFVSACDRLARELAASEEPQAGERFDVACGRAAASGARQGERQVPLLPSPYLERSAVYGQAVAISGDLLETPEDFFSAIGGEKVVSTAYYLALAIVNQAHFMPSSIRHWRMYHARAVSECLSAAESPAGAARTAAFEHAYYLNAFADHFLQDSFAAGHMGFNRPASSTSASFVMHQRWNGEGRVMRNDRGNIWIGYGDGSLRSAINSTTLRLLEQATIESIHSMLYAFVFQRRAPGGDEEVEELVPAMIYSAHSQGYMILPGRYHLSEEERALVELRKRIEAADGDAERRAAAAAPVAVGGKTGTYDDLLLEVNGKVQNRAFKNYGIGVRWIYGGATFTEVGSWQAVLAELNLRALTDSVRFFISAGVAYRPEVEPMLGPGLSWQFASSFHGLVTHDAAFTIWLIPGCDGCFRNLDLVSQLTYRLNIESSRFVLGVFLSPALLRRGGETTIGWLTGLSLETVITAAGGGALRER